MAERYGRDLRRGAVAAFVIVFPMFVAERIIVTMVVIVDVHGVTVVTISDGQRFQRIVMFVVKRVTGVHRMRRLIPLSVVVVVVIIQYGNRLKNFGRNEELLLFKIFCAFVQLWRHHSRRSIFRWRWYSMKQPETRIDTIRRHEWAKKN